MTNCPQCNNTGLLPFIKNGKIISNAHIYCDCHEDEPEHYSPLSPDDFDWPMSYDFHRMLCQEHGWNDPGLNKPREPEVLPPQEIIHRHSNMGKREFDLLQQTAFEVKGLRDKVIELQTSKRASAQSKGKSTYKGIK